MVSIVKANIEDASELIKAKINAFANEVKVYGSGPPGYDSLDEQEKAIDKRLFFKFIEDNKIIGGMGIYDHGARHYEIRTIFVDIKYQNLGIGSMAMEFLAQEFADVQRWTVDTPYKSYRNHHFYEKFGFKKIGETEPDQNGFYLFLFEKKPSKFKLLMISYLIC